MAVSRARRRDWKVRGAIMSTWHPTRLLTGYGWDAITAACLLGPHTPRSLLLLGLGGATVLRQLLHLLPELEVTALDRDPRALEEAPQNLGPAAAQVRMIQADAYAWAAECRHHFDVVIDDIYAQGSEDVFRPVPFDSQLVAKLQPRLAPKGLLVANFVLGPGHRTPFVKARAAFQHAFPQWRSVRPPLGANAILVGGQSVQPASALKAHAMSWTTSERKLWNALRVVR
jgi:spermidine synthase